MAFHHLDTFRPGLKESLWTKDVYVLAEDLFVSQERPDVNRNSGTAGYEVPVERVAFGGDYFREEILEGGVDSYAFVDYGLCWAGDSSC